MKETLNDTAKIFRRCTRTFIIHKSQTKSKGITDDLDRPNNTKV